MSLVKPRSIISKRAAAPTAKPVLDSTASLLTEFDGQLCAEHVMDSVPLVMRFIRAHVQSERCDAPSVSQLRVLSFLCDFPDVSLSQVARFLGVTKATASNTVARMVDKGYVERVEDPNERRYVVLNITEPGRLQYVEAREKAQSAVAEVLTQLTPAQTQKIAEGLLLLRQAFGPDAGNIASSTRGTSV